MLKVPAGAPEWATALVRDIEREMLRRAQLPVKLPTSTVANLPSAASFKDCFVTVSNETGGYTAAFSDGTNWRRVQDRAIVS